MPLAFVSTVLLIATFVVPALIIGVALFFKKPLKDLKFIPLVVAALLLASLTTGIVQQRIASEDALARAVVRVDLALAGMILLATITSLLAISSAKKQVLSVHVGEDEHISNRGDGGRSACTTVLLNTEPQAVVDTGAKVVVGLNTYVYRFVIRWVADDAAVTVRALAFGQVINWPSFLIFPLGVILLLAGRRQIQATATGRIVDCRQDEKGNCQIVALPGKDEQNEDEFSAAVVVNVTPVFAGGGGVAGNNLMDTVRIDAIGAATLEGEVVVERITVGLSASGSATPGGSGGGVSTTFGATAGFEIKPKGALRKAGPKSNSFVYKCGRSAGSDE